MTQLLAIAGVVLVVVYVGLLLSLWRFQEQVVFQPPVGVAATDVLARRVEYRSSDGVELFGYLVGECAPERPVLLAFHGNADLSRWFVPWATRVAQETNSCVMLPEYRGYDGIAGVPSYATSARDAGAALAYLRDSLQIQPAQTIYFGHSLGSAIAAELAAVEQPRALILQSPFSTARAMAKRMFVPGVTWFWTLISRVHFDTIARVSELAAPVFVVHGDRDLVVPVHMGREVFDAARNRGELLIVHGAGHNDVADIGGRAYWQWLDRAIRGRVTDAVIPNARTEKRSAP